MRRPAVVLLVLACVIAALAVKLGLGGRSKTAYPEIPRIDVHAHAGGNVETITSYLRMRERIKSAYDIDLVLWIDLGGIDGPAGSISDPADVTRAAEGRMLSCISDYSSHDGLDYPPAELEQWLERGYIGYKIWAGPPERKLAAGQEGFPYVDDPAHEPTFAKLEQCGILCASIHIGDPCGPWGRRTDWLPDPVEYWRNINAWRNVMERHPNLNVVCAHGMWAICQDGQIDYLRNMLATFPRMNIDLAATFQYFPLVTRENLRSFMIEYADRIVFGTDISSLSEEQADQYALRYWRVFRILETDEEVKGGFFGWARIRGLALPRDVLEKIYYKNAMRLYPRVREQLQQLGYSDL